MSLLSTIIELVEGNIIISLALIIGLIFLFLIVIFNKILSDKIVNLFNKILKNKKTEKLDDRVIEVVNNIDTELAVLRSILKADRAYIYEFHNGDRFLSDKPRYKMSKTHEKVKKGISREIKNEQELDISLYWESIQPFFSKSIDEELSSGIEVLRKNPHCTIENVCVPPKRLYLYDIAKMSASGGYSKIKLENQHIYYTIRTPIVNFYGDILGFIGIDYSEKEDYENIINKPDFDPCQLCKFASRISEAWESDKKIKEKILEYHKKIWKDFKSL